MSRYLTYYLLGALVWLSGCYNRPAPPANQPAAFNLSGFIQEQVQQLNQTHPAVEKTVHARSGAPETKVLQNIVWARELESFMQADIDKPALRAAYAVTTVTIPGGLTKTAYRKRPGYNDAPVDYLEIIATPDQQVKQITGRQSERNYLVNAVKTFMLTCAPVNGRNRLVTYRITGAQKTIFFPELRFDVQARIR